MDVMFETLQWEDSRVRFAVEAVREAALLAREIQRQSASGPLSKEDRSPVTVADFSVQALIGRRLAEAFPDEPLVAEEESDLLASEPEILAEVAGWVARRVPGADSGHLRSWIDRGTSRPERRFWTLDPIDGTKGFLRGDQYVVALAYIEEGRVLLGALGCPNYEIPRLNGKGSVFAALRGAGCRASALLGDDGFEELRVSAEGNIEQARVLRSVEASHTNVSQFDELVRRLGVKAPPVCLDSQAKYGALAAGHGELMLRLLSPARPGYREKIWDHAAGSIVVEEAGGRVTDLSGKALDFGLGRRLEENAGVVASNRRLHPAVLQMLSTLQATG